MNKRKILEGIRAFVMAAILTAAFLCCLYSLSSCCLTVHKSETVKDSVRVEYRDIVREIMRDTTIYVEMPVEKVVEVVVDSSHLETSISASDAWIDTMGLLHHRLENRAVSIAKEVVYVDKIITRDSIVFAYRDREEKVVKKQESIVDRIWVVGFVLFLIVVCVIAYRKGKRL